MGNAVQARRHLCAIVVLLALFVFEKSWAQPDLCNPAPGTFTGSLYVSPGIGCVPLTIKARTGLKDARNVRYVYAYDGGAVSSSKLTTDSVHTYDRPGLYRILQVSEQDDRSLRACAYVQVYDTIPPVVALASCRQTVQLTIPKAAGYGYDWYAVDWGDGSRDSLDGTAPLGTHQYAGSTSRTISVRGIHKYGLCGGTTRQRFQLVVGTALPTLLPVRAKNKALEVTIQNPGAGPLWIEEKQGANPYRRTAIQVFTEMAVLTIPADLNEETCFRLVLSDSCAQSAPSAEACYVPPPQPQTAPALDSVAYLPDAFSPNADGNNDRFLLQGLRGRPARLTVFDRWGEVIFRTDDAAAGWDGTQNGQPLPPGAYPYQVDLGEPGGKRLRKQGVVILIK